MELNPTVDSFLPFISECVIYDLLGFSRPRQICFAKCVNCEASRGFLNTTMYCAFKLMVRLSLYFGKRFCTRYMTDVFEWWLFLVKRSVTRPSVSAIRSSNTTTLRLLVSKTVGNPCLVCRDSRTLTAIHRNITWRVWVLDWSWRVHSVVSVQRKLFFHNP